MCQMAKNPSMREKSEDSTNISVTVSAYSVAPGDQKDQAQSRIR